MSNAKEQSKGNVFYYDPADIVRITDEKDPLFDPEVNAPPDEGLVLSMMDPEIGFLADKPLNVESRGPNQARILVLVDGRRRHAAAVEANRRLRKAGESKDALISVPVVFNKGRDVVVAMAVANEHIKVRSTLERARKAGILRLRGKSDDTIARVMGITKATLGSWWTLLKASPEELKAIEAGQAVATEVVANVRKGRVASGVRRKPKERVQLPIAKVRELYNALQPGEGDTADSCSDFAIALLAFVLGEDRTAKALREVQGSETLVKVATKVRRAWEAEK